MQKYVRIAIAGLAAFLMVLVLTGTAHSQDWNSNFSTGLTSLSWDLEDNTYTWTLTNKSSLADDPYSLFDILVWDLMPYQIQEPTAWSAPEGWRWGDSSMELVSNSYNYKTPYALGPGQSLTFTYTINPNGRYINTSGPIDAGPLFGAHIAAVIPGSGSYDGEDRWEDYYVRNFGRTWHEKVYMTYNQKPVPEPSSFIAMGFGACGLTTLCIRRRLKRL